uniref:mitochondrial import inner membrane translocase subunit Tim10 n=1 Tax=Myxine glutinosa TaxID=7769 RepID=UPI00358F0911
MDVGKMQNLAAELEVDMMADMYNRLTSSCRKKCIPPGPREAELGKAESVCLDRCVAKYLSVHETLGRRLATLSQRDEELMASAAPAQS